MSLTVSQSLSRGQFVVAIIGGTGRLGRIVTSTFLQTYKPFFSRIIVPTRDTTTQTAKLLALAGAEVVQVAFNPTNDEELISSLRGVDVVINLLGSSSGEAHTAVASAAVKCGVRVYFLSEFGVDHRLNDFPGYDHPDWEVKRVHEREARDLAAGGGMKVVSVYTSLFLEDSFGPWFGYDIPNHTLTLIGSPSTKVSFTSKPDIARSLAELSLRALSHSADVRDGVAEYVRVAGCSRSAEEVAGAFGGGGGGGGSADGNDFVLRSVSVEEAKLKLRHAAEKGEIQSPAEHIQVLMGEGKLDWSGSRSGLDNQNELVNPNGEIWKWKTVEDFARETGRRGSC